MSLVTDEELYNGSEEKVKLKKRLDTSRKNRTEILNYFDNEKLTSILQVDRAFMRETDLSTKKGKRYEDTYNTENLPLEFRETGLITQGLGTAKGALSRFPKNIGKVMVKLYCPDDGIIYDPFAGHDSRMSLVHELGYEYIGVDICREFMDDNEITRKKLVAADAKKLIKNDKKVTLLCQSSTNVPEVLDSSCDFTLTSPPYWDVEYYGPEEEQLGTGKTYAEFLEGLALAAKENYRILKKGAFCCWFINDFKRGGKFYPYHIDTFKVLESVGFIPFNIYIVDLGPSPIGSIFIHKSLTEQRVLPKRHEYIVVFYK